MTCLLEKWPFFWMTDVLLLLCLLMKVNWLEFQRFLL